MTAPDVGPVQFSEAGLPLRTCMGCAATDDHPKHEIDHGGGLSIYWHFDCHVIATGCPDVCGPARVGADGLTGAAFREHIVATAGGANPAPKRRRTRKDA